MEKQPQLNKLMKGEKEKTNKKLNSCTEGNKKLKGNIEHMNKQKANTKMAFINLIILLLK